ncbi:MAG: acyltransferase [Paracoccaceae bacterium]|jgi:peptidoglycan/LPS O-acetylase OafA/YrhL
MVADTAEKSNAPKIRMSELDGLRALAILFVMAFHSWYFLHYTLPSMEVFLEFSDSLPWIFGFIRRGDLGVDIFFVLSGYLLAWQLFRKRMKTGEIRVKSFYAHRIFRIYPLYLVALGLAAIDVGITTDMLGNLLGYNIWTTPANIIIPWTWSLSVELEFYAIVPLLILLIRSGKDLAIMTTVIVLFTIGWNYWILSSYPQIATHSFIDLLLNGRGDDSSTFYHLLYIAMPARISQFTLGMAGAWIVLNRSAFLAELSKKTVTILTILIVLGAAFPLTYNPFTIVSGWPASIIFYEILLGRTIFAAAIALMIVLLHAGRLPTLKRVLSSRLLEPVARYSFSMYLFHPIFVYLGVVAFVGLDKVPTVSILQYIGVAIITLTGSMLTGWITWRFIEGPAIRFGRKHFR